MQSEKNKDHKINRGSLFKPGRDYIQGLKASVVHRYILCPSPLGARVGWKQLANLPACRRHLFPLLHGNRRRLHAGSWRMGQSLEPCSLRMTREHELHWSVSILNTDAEKSKWFHLFSWHAESIAKVTYQAVSSELKLNYIAKSHSIDACIRHIISVNSLWTLSFVFRVIVFVVFLFFSPLETSIVAPLDGNCLWFCIILCCLYHHPHHPPPPPRPATHQKDHTCKWHVYTIGDYIFREHINYYIFAEISWNRPEKRGNID